MTPAGEGAASFSWPVGWDGRFPPSVGQEMEPPVAKRLMALSAGSAHGGQSSGGGPLAREQQHSSPQLQFLPSITNPLSAQHVRSAGLGLADASEAVCTASPPRADGLVEEGTLAGCSPLLGGTEKRRQQACLVSKGHQRLVAGGDLKEEQPRGRGGSACKEGAIGRLDVSSGGQGSVALSVARACQPLHRRGGGCGQGRSWLMRYNLVRFCLLREGIGLPLMEGSSFVIDVC